MASRATSVNPAVLVWARERAGLSKEEVAEMVGRPPDVITAWETGERAPTYRQLETLAGRCYKRPLAIFFFPSPPAEKDLESEFRTLPSDEFAKLEADTLYALREARAFQASLREISGGRNHAVRQLLRDIEASVDESASALADRVRAYLGISVGDQTEWRDSERAFNEWRGALESVGVYVFKRSFVQDEVSGFCLHDAEFPVIMINNSTSFARQTFTLFHELAHLLYRVSGITTADVAYVDNLPGPERAIEVACNRFAAAFLVPGESFPWRMFTDPFDVRAAVAELARHYSVSREVILRRLLDADILDRTTYRSLTEEWKQDYRRPGGQPAETTISLSCRILATRTFGSRSKGTTRAVSRYRNLLITSESKRAILVPWKSISNDADRNDLRPRHQFLPRPGELLPRHVPVLLGSLQRGRDGRAMHFSRRGRKGTRAIRSSPALDRLDRRA
jgi:Zn-dependent peptidase ImmA (M78 family)